MSQMGDGSSGPGYYGPGGTGFPGGWAGWHVPGYTELRPLGRGGFGDVVLARHDASGILVAIKYLRGDLITDPSFTQGFRREAAVLSSLDDPNVVRLYEYVESDAGAAIVMELVDGVSLREILSRQGQTTAEAALVVLQGSLLGLAAAHRQGVVHRDYKPENVLVNGDGVSKLTDFGIAARAGDRPIPAGTLSYAAPEQMRGAPATPASDVYSATATFYECLTGRPPFVGDSAERLIYQHQFEPVPLGPLPGPLRPLVEAGMSKEPGYRPTDGTSLVAALRTAAAGAYGPAWEERGRSHLSEAALLLAALWPLGAPPAVHGFAVEHLDLSGGAGGHGAGASEGYGAGAPGGQGSGASGRGGAHAARSRHLLHVLHLDHLAHLRHLLDARRFRGISAAAVAGIVAVLVVGGAVLAYALVHSSGPATLQPASTPTPSASLPPSTFPPTPSPSVSPSPSLSSSPPAFLAPAPTPAAPATAAPSPSKTSASPAPTPTTTSPSPSPTTTSPSPSPTTTSPSPSPTTTSPSPSPTTTSPTATPTTTPPIIP
jgi:eukaryotic-like serine/threonine-protein kinase